MNIEIKKLWAKALRSGDYKQGTGTLIRYTNENVGKEYVPDETALKDASYCCLGVLCEVYRKVTGQNLWNGLMQFDNSPGLPPSKVIQWANITKNPMVKVNGEFKTLSELNDHENFNFNQIADIIEEQL